jgi:predicted metal-dependent peptidase
MLKQQLTSMQGMRTSRAKMLMRMPFFGILSLQMRLIEVEPDHPFFQTMATDGENIYFNPVFADLIGDEGRQFVIAHEVMHVITDTIGRMGSRDQMLWNMASDYAINQLLKDANMRMPTNAELAKAANELKARLAKEGKADRADMIIEQDLEKLPQPDKVIGLQDDKYRGWTSEQIYEDLRKNPPPESQRGTIDQHMRPGQSDQGTAPRGKDGKTYTRVPGLTPEKARELARQWKQRANMAAQQHGNLPEGIRRLLDELNEPKITWREFLNIKLTSMAKSNYTWNPPHKSHFGRGFTLPRVGLDDHIRLAIVVDASGSITKEMVTDVMSEIVGICQQFRSWELLVMSFDTEIYDPVRFTQDDFEGLLDYHIKGGGGTFFKPSLAYLAGEIEHKGQFCEYKFDQVLFFTDGYGEGWCQEYDGIHDIIWILSQDPPNQPSWGTAVRYDGYK